MNTKHSTYSRIIFWVVLVFSVVACSRKRDKFINRNFHAMGAYYNIIFNGQNALADGVEQLDQDYIDDYWEILPIERMQVKDQASLPGDAKNEHFARAEEKATKAIQKHNMLINGEEHNPQMDKAFLLLGKARYYDQRFFPALEAFNYILTKYDESNQLVTAKIWREKTNMRLNNNEVALENLKKLFAENVEIEDQDRADACAAMAQAYLNLGIQDSAIMPLDTAIAYTKSKAEKGRYLYIKGQVYERLGKTDSANHAFDQVIDLNRKSPRPYMIHAYMEKAKNYNPETGNNEEFLEMLNDMAENRENRPFLDVIYFQTAEYYREIDSIPSAKTYYNKSLRTNSKDKGLLYRDYLTLGNIYFDEAEYKVAGAYYDSTLVNLEESTRLFRSVRKKRENLDDVIKYEDIAKVDDSILHLVNMPEKERLAYFSEYAETLKQKAIADAEKAKKDAKRNNGTANMFARTQSSASSATPPGGGGGGKFYFYNQNQVGLGEQTFKLTWGNRELKDDWRTNPSTGSGDQNEEGNEEADYMAEIESNPMYDPQTYIAQLPSAEREIDSINKERNFAYYQLGIIYKEKFKEYKLAANKLETLLKNNPEERLVLPSKYNLYKIYTTIGNTERANYWKNDIISNYPDSRYATILQNPRGLLNSKDSPEAVYKEVYRLYQQEKYKEVIERCEQEITHFTGDDIVPKFELLKATAAGRYYGFDAYKEGLNYVALNYPQSEEGKRAEEIVSNSLKELEKASFAENTVDQQYNLIYPFAVTEKENAEALYKKINEAIAEFDFTNLTTSIDFYTPEETFVVVHGFASKLGAEGLGQKLNEEKEYKIEHSYFGISSGNYKVIQVHKNLQDYLSSSK